MADIRSYAAWEKHLAEQTALQRGGGGGTSGGMEDRVTRLETHFEYVRKDLDDLKTDQKAVLQQLAALQTTISTLPTKRDLDSWRWQWIATGVAIVALVVGGVTGGLALISRFG